MRTLPVDRFSLWFEDLKNGKADADAEAEAEAESDTKAVLPPFNPFSPSSVASREDARLNVHLTRLHCEAQEKAQACQAKLNLRLAVRRLEIEADTQVKLRQLDLHAMEVASRSAAQPDPGQVSTDALSPGDSS